MKTHRLLIVLTLLAIGACCSPARAQQQAEKNRLLIILDCSQSMWDRWQSDSKIKVTQHVLLRFLDSIQGQTDMEVALRVFGHLNNGDFGTSLEVPFEQDNFYKLRSKIKTLVPNGGCTAASAFSGALKDFPSSDHVRNIILVITDGLDECDGNICDVARQVNESGTVVQTFIIGIGNPDNFKHQLDCAGRFTLLTDEERFDETLYEVILLSDQKARVTLALLDADNRLYETDVPVTFHDSRTHALRYSTIYHYGTEDPVDTLDIDPLVNYDITLFTKPPIRLADRHFKPGRHTPLAIPAPQGSLMLHFGKQRTAFQVPAYTMLVRRSGDPAILATQPLGTKANYLAGSYDIEVLTLPVTRIEKIQLQSGSSSDLELPMPGQLAFDKPQEPTLGSIFVRKANGLQWVCDLDPASPTERIVLMPGDYELILRPLKNPSSGAVRSAHFTIRSAQQTGLKASDLR